MSQRPKKKGYRIGFTVFIFFGFFAFTLLSCSRQSAKSAEERGTLEIYFLDVGQGDSTLIKDASGKSALIDSGPAGDGVAPMLHHLGVSSFYLVIGSHADADHIGEMSYILQSFPTELYIDPQLPHTTRYYLNLLLTLKTLVEAGKTKYMKPEGQILLGETLLEIFPSPNPPFEGSNNNSVIVRVVYGQFTLLLTGDAESDEEQWLMSHFPAESLKARVLKVAHHGSHTGTTSPFLNSVQPEVGIISVGRGNPYGHPHKEVLDRLHRHKVAIFRTDELGTLTLLTRGKDYEIRANGRLIYSPEKVSEDTTARSPSLSLHYLLLSTFHFLLIRK